MWFFYLLVNCNDVVSHPLDSPLPSEKLPNGVGARVSSGGPPAVASAPPAGVAVGKAPTTRDPKSRARSREYLKQCLQEISYLTSPQAMNPLPNRPLISNPNPSMGLGGNAMNPSATGGVGLGGMTGGMGGVGQGQGMAQGQGPSFDSVYNGRPRKQLPDSAGPGISGVGVGGAPGKEFPILGSSAGSSAMGVMSGSGSSPASSVLERANQLAIANAAMYQQQQQAPVQAQPQQSQENQPQRNPAPSQPPSQPQTQPPQQQQQQQQQDGIGQTPATRQEGDFPKPVTMIFRPDDGGEWKEKLRSSYEQQVQQWRESEEEEPEEVGEEEEEVESVSVVDEADGESSKLWKAKRTLRKCVFDLFLVMYRLILGFQVTSTQSVHSRSTPLICAWPPAVMTVRSRYGVWTWPPWHPLRTSRVLARLFVIHTFVVPVSRQKASLSLLFAVILLPSPVSCTLLRASCCTVHPSTRASEYGRCHHTLTRPMHRTMSHPLEASLSATRMLYGISHSLGMRARSSAVALKEL
jgi:hypothetical protein